MKAIIQRKLFTRAVHLVIRENPGMDRKEIKEILWKQWDSEMHGSVLSATITLLSHKLIRQEGGKPARFYPL